LAGAFALNAAVVPGARLALPVCGDYAAPLLYQSSAILPIRAIRPGLHEFTAPVREFVAASGMSEGLLTLFCNLCRLSGEAPRI
jgi:hypothetical protein